MNHKFFKTCAFIAVLAWFGLTSESLHAFGFFNITSTTISQLDADSYRLRLSVDFENNLEDDLPTNMYSYLRNFNLTGEVSAYNYYATHGFNSAIEDFSTPGPEGWLSQLDDTPETLGQFFGFDFDFIGPLSGLEFGYSSIVQQYAHIRYQNGTYGYIVEGEQTYAGTFRTQGQAPSVPEPSTWLLFGLGGAAVAVLYSKRPR